MSQSSGQQYSLNAQDAEEEAAQTPLVTPDEDAIFDTDDVDNANDFESAGMIQVEKIYFNILQKSKFGCGKFQWMMFFILLLGMNGFSFINMGIGFYELMPTFLCLDKEAEYTCTNQQICQGQKTPQIKFRIDWLSPTSLHNWSEQLDLICYPKWHIGCAGTAFFLGWACTILFVPRMADKYGRKWVFIWSLIVTMVMMLLMIYVSRSLNETIAYLFISGMAASGRTTVGFVFASEFFAPKWRMFFATFFLITTAFTGFFLCLWFEVISKHYIYCASIGSVTTTISFVLCAIYVEESPLWQLKKGYVEEAQETLRTMMKYNGVEDADEMIEELKAIAEYDMQNPETVTRQQQSTLDFLKNPIIFRNLVIVGLLWSITWFNYYIFKFQIKYLPGLVFHNYMADSLSNMIAIPISAVMYKFLSLKPTFTILLAISMAGGFLILFLGHSHSHLMALFIGIAKFGVSGGFLLLLVATLEMFPMMFAAQALGFMNFFGRFFAAGAPQTSERPEPVPMIVFLSLCSLGICLIWLTKPLKEQLKVAPRAY